MASECKWMFFKMEQLKRKSKFLSLLLRHKPEIIGLSLDSNGWANISDLLSLAAEDFTLEILQEIVSTDEKQRYTLDLENLRIRANQGHSIQIDLELKAIQPPEFLFHGTQKRNLLSIFQTGLSKQNRHHVHMTESQELAKKRGPVLLTIMSGEMFRRGINFYKTVNNVWLTDFVDPKFLKNQTFIE